MWEDLLNQHAGPEWRSLTWDPTAWQAGLPQSLTKAMEHCGIQVSRSATLRKKATASRDAACAERWAASTVP
eukprot:3690498-Pyramimonas_sp.AAC.1